MSPHLFVIIMEALRRMMSAVMTRGLISGSSVGDRNDDSLFVSHLLFANDDTHIFRRVALDNFQYRRIAPLCFKVVLGLNINLAKSKWFMSVMCRM